MSENLTNAVNSLNEHGLPLLTASYILPLKPNSFMLSNWYSKAIINYTDSIDVFEKKYDIESSCKEGCSLCCKHLIGLVMYEVNILKSNIRALSRDDRSRIKDKCIYICNQLQEHGWNEENFIINNVFGTTINEDMKDIYFALGLDCPLLHNGKCSLYSFRPVTCFSYRCYGNPSKCNERINHETISYGDYGINKSIDDEYMRIKGMTQPKLRILPYALLDIT